MAASPHITPSNPLSRGYEIEFTKMNHVCDIANEEQRGVYLSFLPFGKFLEAVYTSGRDKEN